jgi:hypothetical protein
MDIEARVRLSGMAEQNVNLGADAGQSNLLRATSGIVAD